MSVFRTKCTSHTAAKFHWQHSLLTLHTGFYNSRNLLTLPQPSILECTSIFLSVAVANVTVQMPTQKHLTENEDLTFILASLILNIRLQ